jgi:membrane-bound inhibitor of C-type lysozyme
VRGRAGGVKRDDARLGSRSGENWRKKRARESSMRVILAIASLLLASACQTPCLAPSAEPVSRVYSCDDGSTLHATFTRAPDAVHVEQDGYIALDLPARISGTGYRYSEHGVELRGRAGETVWSRPGAADTICRAGPIGAG